MPNLISFEQDVGDGNGMTQFQYDPHKKILYIEPNVTSGEHDFSGVNWQPDGHHASEYEGMLPITEKSTMDVQKFLWSATRPYREYYDLGYIGVPGNGNGSQPKAQQQPTQVRTQEQQSGVHINEQEEEPDKDVGRPPHLPPIDREQVRRDLENDPNWLSDPPDGPFVSMPIDEYVNMKNAVTVELQGVMIKLLQQIIQARLDADDPVHEIVNTLAEEAQRIKEKYEDARSETD